MPGQQRRRRVHQRLPVRLSRVGHHRRGEPHAEQRQRAVLLRPQDHGRAAGRLAADRQHAGQDRAAGPGRMGGHPHVPAEHEPDAGHARHRVRRHERGADGPVPDDGRLPLAGHCPAVRPRGRVRPAGRGPGPARRPARQHAGAQMDRGGPRVQGDGHDPLPGHRRQRLVHHRRRAHVRERLQQPGRALPRPQRDRRPSDQGHRRGVQHLQHAQADPGAVAAVTRAGRLLRLLRERPVQPPPRPAAPGRRARARHLLHPAQPRRAPRRRPGLGRRHLEHGLQLLLVLPGHRDRDQHQADGLDLLPRRHHPVRESVRALHARLERSRHHDHPDDLLSRE